MFLDEQILNKLREEFKLKDEALVNACVMKRKEEILKQHIENVFPIKAPGEKGGNPRYWMTKRNPKDRNKDGKLYGKTQEELENKIIAYYLGIKQTSLSVRDILEKAVGDNKTGTRTLQRFDKRLPSLAKLKLYELTEKTIRQALDELVESGVKAKEYQQTLTCFSKIYTYCDYEHLDVCNIPKILSTYRAVKLTGKHVFKQVNKRPQDLAFNLSEASKIVDNALEHPSYKGLAVALLLTTGLRIGELLALTKEDIFLNEGYIWICKTEDTKSKPPKILDYAKENKPRQVFWAPKDEDVIKACLDFREKDSSDSPYLFLNSKTKDCKMHCGDLDKYLRKEIHRKLLGYGDEKEARSAHDCRRTYASLAYLKGTPIYTIMEQLGHNSVLMTEKYIQDVIEPIERRKGLSGWRP